MVRTMPLLSRILALGALVALVVAAGCGGDDESGGGPPTLPASWAGTWEIQGDATICDSDSVVESLDEIEVFCAGEDFEFDLDELASFRCNGTWTDTDADVTCTASYSAEGVTCNATARIQASRSAADADIFTATIRVSATCTGPGAPEAFCLEQEVLGTRTSMDQTGCSQPVMPLLGDASSRIAAMLAGEER